MTKEEFIHKCTNDDIDIVDRNTFVLNYVLESTNVTDLLNIIKDNDIFKLEPSILEAITIATKNSNCLNQYDTQYINLLKRISTIDYFIAQNHAQ